MELRDHIRQKGGLCPKVSDGAPRHEGTAPKAAARRKLTMDPPHSGEKLDIALDCLIASRSLGFAINPPRSHPAGHPSGIIVVIPAGKKAVLVATVTTESNFAPLMGDLRRAAEKISKLIPESCPDLALHVEGEDARDTISALVKALPERKKKA